MVNVGFVSIFRLCHRSRSSGVVVAALVLSLAAGCRRTGGEAPAPALPVQVIRAAATVLPEEITAAGAIEAVDKAEVAFFVAGRVAELTVEDGAEVRKDDVLARLDPGDYRQALDAAEARLAEVSARHARLARLHELGSLTDSDFDKIDSALREVQAGAEVARRRLADTELRAPFAGRAVRRNLAVGTVVGPAVPVFTVLATSPVWASVGANEAEARRVQAGQAARVFLPATGDHAYTGKVETVLPQADPLSRSFTVKIRLANADGVLHHGNVVTARIATGAQRTAVLVPPAAVCRFPDGALFVWTVDPQRSAAVRRIVTTDGLQPTAVEITSGLKGGEQVVLNAATTLYEGQLLQVTAAP